MPYVRIAITRDGVTRAHKQALIEGATDLLVHTLDKNPATTVVVIEEVDTDNWGIGGESVTVRRGRGAAASSGALPPSIRGDEVVAAGTALATLVEFYRAFNARELEAVIATWCADPASRMDNPIGGVRIGVDAIHAGYQRLFTGPAQVTVELFDVTAHAGPGYCLFTGRERGTCRTAAGTLELRIRTSRLLVRQAGQWRQRHHHGSIDEPALLADYQRAVLGAAL